MTFSIFPISSSRKRALMSSTFDQFTPAIRPQYAEQVLPARSRTCHQLRTPVAITLLPLVLFLCSPVLAQHEGAKPGSPTAPETPNLYDPVADPKAVVLAGNARFTVLTPQLIRMEWAADAKFEDHASLVFLNRRLPVPRFAVKEEGPPESPHYTITTEALQLDYNSGRSPADTDTKFTRENLSLRLTVNGKDVTWRPGMPDTGNLSGTTRTLDGALGGKTREPMDPGLISRDGWAVVDDSTRPLFDSTDFRFLEGESSPWPWVVLRPPGERQDWYFFGYGHDYKQALADFIKVAGRIPLPPRFAFGAWWSRYWAYADQELDELVRGFRENDTPLDVLVV